MRILKLLVVAGLLATHGCAVVAVGAVAAAAGGVTYTVLGTAEKTYYEDYDAVPAALQTALVTLDIKTGDTQRNEENGKVVMTEIEAYTGDLTIRISIHRVSDKATRVVVDTSRNFLIKDKATAAGILNQTTDNLSKKS